MVLMEARHCWTCLLHQQGIHLVAGFDRAGSGRTVLVSNEPNGPKQKVPNVPNTDKPEPHNEETEEESTTEAQTIKRIIEGFDARGGDIELQTMSEVRKGKQRMP